MDAARFDAFSRQVGTSADRRGVLKTLAGGMLGVVGLAAASDAALGKKQCQKDKDCKGNKVCKNDKCVECKNDSNCNGGRVCEKKKCVDCRKNKDCKHNQKCKNNKCVKK
jgi:hypothetical protein